MYRSKLFKWEFYIEVMKPWNDQKTHLAGITQQPNCQVNLHLLFQWYITFLELHSFLLNDKKLSKACQRHLMKRSDDMLTVQQWTVQNFLNGFLNTGSLCLSRWKNRFFLISKNSILKKKKKSGFFPSFLSYTQCSVCCMLNDLINWEPLVRKTMVLSLPRSNISIKLPDLPDSDFESWVKLRLIITAQMYLQPHYGNGVFGNVYLSAGQR